MIQLRSVQSNLKDYNFVCNSILFLFKNDSFTIEFVVDQEDNISFQKEEWPKLIFGVVEPKYLIGFKADKNEFILNVLVIQNDLQDVYYYYPIINIFLK